MSHDPNTASLASPAFTGTPTAPTPTSSDNSTKLATTTFVAGQGFPTAITLNTGGVIHQTPVNFTVSGGTATGSLVLNTQAAATVLAGPTSGANAAPTFRAIAAADLPASITSSTTGTAANVTGTVALANGGTGQTTQQAAINALTGTQAAGKYLRSDGTNATLSAIAAADVPTLNQSTTGTAANVTGTVAVANGGTGQTTAAAAFNSLAPLTTLGDILYASAANTSSRLAGNTTSAKQFLTQTGTGSASAAPAWGALAASDIPNIAESQVTNLTTDLAAKLGTGTGNVSAVTASTESSTTAQNLMSYTVAAGSINSANKTLEVWGAGVATINTTATYTITVKLGSLTLLTATSASVTATVANMPWNLLILLTTATTGTSGAVEAHGSISLRTAAGAGSATEYVDGNTAALSTIDLTASQTLQVTVTFSANGSGGNANSCTQRQLVVSPKN